MARKKPKAVKATRKCDTVTMSVRHDPSGHQLGTFTVPAYTRREKSFREELNKQIEKYIDLSVEEYGRNARVSIGDFILRLIAFSEGEPREQSEKG